MAETLTADGPGLNAVIADQGMVYCRFPDGSIEACDASPMEIMKKIQRGIQPLAEYGQFGSNVYYMANPFEPLFQAGGAHELSTDQIVAMGYHLRPPLVPTCEKHVGQARDHLSHEGSPKGTNAKAQGCWRGARPAQFPQLERVEVPSDPGECEYCGRDDFPTLKSLKQHQEVMHADRRQQQALGDAIVQGLSTTGVLKQGVGADAQTIAAAVAATLQAMGYTGPDEPRRKSAATRGHTSTPDDE